MSSNNVAPGSLTRQELYDKIRETSKDEYILSEMKRLGFWETGKGKPTVAEKLVSRRGELQGQLAELLKKQRMYEDPEAALKALRKERMEAARAKRVETRTKQADERHQKALAWHERQQNEITWLGEAVSLGLKQGLKQGQAQAQAQAQPERLQTHNLPAFANHKAFAEAMGISLNELRFLTYDRTTSKVSHYKHFQIAKKTGGFRNISAPMPRLKRSQYWVLDNILAKMKLHDAAHGFVLGRSIITNATPHVGKGVVINMDLKDFFPTITYRRVKGLFHKAGYSESLATVLALLCCEPDVTAVDMDGEHYFVQQGERHLPQGAPTSPMISNLLCRALDRRLMGLAKKYGFTYTRYADDLTFSGSKEALGHIGKILFGTEYIVTKEGFVLHPDKTRVMKKGRQQEVTGLVVNDRLSVDRKSLKKFRALLHQAGKTGLSGKSWNGSRTDKQLLRSMLGYANFVAMVIPEKGAGLKEQAKGIALVHKGSFEKNKQLGKVRKAEFRALCVAGLAPMENWKQAGEKPAPVREKTRDELEVERQAKIAARRELRQAEQQASRRQAANDPWDNRGDTDSFGSGGGFMDFVRQEESTIVESSSAVRRTPGNYLSLGEYDLNTLDVLNGEIEGSLEGLGELSSLEFIRMMIFDRERLSKVGLALTKVEMLVHKNDYAGFALENVVQSKRQSGRLYHRMRKIYAGWRTKAILYFVFWLLLTAWLYNRDGHWSGWAIFGAVMALFKVKDIVEKHGHVTLLDQWYRKASDYIQFWTDHKQEEGAAVGLDRSRPDHLEAYNALERHELDKENGTGRCACLTLSQIFLRERSNG